MALRVILTTGGTGGHIFPALAVAEALKKRLPDTEVLFVGGQYGPEADLVARAGLEFYGLTVRGMLGRGLKALPAMAAMARGIFQAGKLIGERKPDVVMGFGGYAAFATVFAAFIRGLPTGVHEQNAMPGTANRLLGKFVRRICLSLPDLGHAFPSAKCVTTGNPIRADIAELGKAGAREPRLKQKAGRSRPHLLIMGGSQGARALNSLGIIMLAKLRDAGVDILHQTGSKDLDRVRAAYRSHGYAAEDVEEMVQPFVHDMAAAYEWADLALCRAGATSLAELAATGTPSVLVPFPYAAHDHQTGNAKAMQNAGGGILVPESEIEECNMADLVLSLLADHERLVLMSEGALSLARPRAAEAVAEEILALARFRNV